MHKNKNLLILLFLLVFAAGVLPLAPEAAAQTQGLQYTLLEKIPGTDNVGSDLPGYLKAIYKVALIIIVLSAVLMLSIGGFMYLTSAGNTSAMGTAKGVIFDSIIGLVIALTAYLLLYVINPDLVNITINGLSPTAVPGAPPKAPPTAPGAAWPDDEPERTSLGSNFSYNNKNCTTEGQAARCTSLAGTAAISGLKALQAACKCSIQITGGTEYWHHGTGGHHRPGDYAIDLGHGAVDTYIKNGRTPTCYPKHPKTGEPRPAYVINGALFWDEDSNHWHANLNTTSCSGF